MRFYKIKATADEKLFDGAERKGKKNNEVFTDFTQRACLLNDEIAAKAEPDFRINFSTIDYRAAILCMVSMRDDEDVVVIREKTTAYLKKHDYAGSVLAVDEITGRTWRDMLRQADREGFIKDFDDTMEKYGMRVINGNRYGGFSFDEFVLFEDNISLRDATKHADALCTIPVMKEEFERIYASKDKKWRPGHPVHYSISADDGEDESAYIQLLLGVLFTNHRVASRRYTQIDYESLCDGYDESRLNEVYRIGTGGTVVIRIRKNTADDDNYVTGSENRSADLCRMAMKWKSKVLTVFCFPRESHKLREYFFEQMDGMSLINIEETVIFDADAKAYLGTLAKQHAARTNMKLLGMIEADTGYSKMDLRKIFDHWYDGYLKEKIYPQYAQKAIAMRRAEKEVRGSGIEQLRDLIGLTETKELVEDILNYAKVQKHFSEVGKRKRQSMHMIFSGNPGSAKTTVARLIARILKENGVLKNGNLIEVGRSDLVGKYVGWTAVQVKKAFEKASGSVLFIDEAYSLVDDRGGSFGDEAINTIVQEMENRRDDIVVILAGYPGKMEEFLGKNPGLRSRINFHVNFPDYSPKELYEILEMMAEKSGLSFADGVYDRVLPILTRATSVSEFGNGRYVRNLLEKAQMRQASRIMHLDPERITEKVAMTLTEDDFAEVRLHAAKSSRKAIGFTA
jgi:AAA+ superfamily predicted ATPase